MPGDGAPGARQAQAVLRTVCVRARSPAVGRWPPAPPLLPVAPSGTHASRHPQWSAPANLAASARRRRAGLGRALRTPSIAGPEAARVSALRRLTRGRRSTTANEVSGGSSAAGLGTEKRRGAAAKRRPSGQRAPGLPVVALPPQCPHAKASTGRFGSIAVTARRSRDGSKPALNPPTRSCGSARARPSRWPGSACPGRRCPSRRRRRGSRSPAAGSRRRRRPRCRPRPASSARR